MDKLIQYAERTYLQTDMHRYVEDWNSKGTCTDTLRTGIVKGQTSKKKINKTQI